MTPGSIAAIAYGILALVGGIIGYVQVKSKASLISGSISGILLIITGVIASQGIGWGLLLAEVVTVALMITFAIRLQKTRKFMPAGVMLIAGVIALAVMVFA